MGKSKNWTVEKKDEIETILIDMWSISGMTIPDNYEDIVQFCYENICETVNVYHWNNVDVAIAFRRWIENQSKDNVQPNKTSPAIGEKLQTVGELRLLMSDLKDNDIICIETIDDIGNVEDLCPMYLDVIEGIERGSQTINEVRFCQMPNV